MNDGTTGRETDLAAAGNGDLAALSRRRFVKGAIATAPVLATLPSGAALARSSNLITSTTVSGSKDALGRTLCLDKTSGAGVTAGGAAVDLGTPARGRLTAIRDRDFRVDDQWSAAQVAESTMCKNGGDYYYRASWGWKKVSVPKGMLVSATALSSFAGSIIVTEI
jgi:hypothetical protein